MWIFTETGFISAVKKPDDGAFITVRSRDRMSLEPLASFTETEINRSLGGDYPYRVRVDQVIFAQWLFAQAASVEYDNFKSRVAVTRGYEYALELGRVWGVMIDTEDEEARNGL